MIVYALEHPFLRCLRARVDVLLLGAGHLSDFPEALLLNGELEDVVAHKCGGVRENSTQPTVSRQGTRKSSQLRQKQRARFSPSRR